MGYQRIARVPLIKPFGQRRMLLDKANRSPLAIPFDTIGTERSIGQHFMFN